MTARASLGADGDPREWVTAEPIASAAPAPTVSAPDGPTDPALYAQPLRLVAPDARLWRALLAPIVASARTFAARARERASADDTRAAYANGAADAALVVAVAVSDALAQLERGA